MNPPKQIAGCLPAGYGLDSMLTPEQFCVWRGVSRRWFGANANSLPGVICESRNNKRIHPRTYLTRAIGSIK